MSSFSVTPAALDAYANLLGSSKAPDAGSTLDYRYLIPYGDYVSDHVKLGGGGFIFALLKTRVEEISTKLTFDSSLISTNLTESAMGLNNAAQIYRDTDFAAARHLDSLYHPQGVTRLDGADAGASPVDPTTNLVEPSEDGGVPDLAQELLDAGGVFSESDLVIKILKWCGLDIVGWARDKLAGDTRELARCASALSHLSDFDDDASNDVADGAAHMLTRWTGNAADAAQSAFAQTSSALAAHGTASSGVASRMGALLVGIQEGMAALEGGLTTLIDRAVEAAAAVAAAGCLEEVPGIDVLADIIGAAEVYRVVKAVKEFFDIWNIIWAGHEGIVGLIAGLVGGLSDWDAGTALPSIGYYNGSQGPAPDYSGDDRGPHGAR